MIETLALILPFSHLGPSSDSGEVSHQLEERRREAEDKRRRQKKV